MNRDHGRGAVFHDPDDYRAFLDTLLDDYTWSSYTAYVGLTNASAWLS